MPKAPKDKSTTNSNKNRQTIRVFNEIMGLPAKKDQEASGRIRIYLRKLIVDHFDWHKTANNQNEATWKEVDDKIKRNMPNIYSTPERRRATQEYMNRYFSNAGHTFRKGQVIRGNGSVDEDASDDDTETAVETPSLPPKDKPNTSINASQDPQSCDVIDRDVNEASGPTTSTQLSCASYITPPSSEPEGISIRIVINKTVNVEHASLALQIAGECEAILTSLGSKPNAQ